MNNPNTPSNPFLLILILISFLGIVKLNAVTLYSISDTETGGVFSNTRTISESLCNQRFNIILSTAQAAGQSVLPTKNYSNGTCSIYGNSNYDNDVIGYVDYSSTHFYSIKTYFSTNYNGFNIYYYAKSSYPDMWNPDGTYIEPCVGIVDNNNVCCEYPNVLLNGVCTANSQLCPGSKGDFPPSVISDSNGVYSIACTQEPVTCEEMKNKWISSCSYFNVNVKGSCEEQSVGLSYPPTIMLVNNFRCFDSKSSTTELTENPSSPTLNDDNTNATDTTDTAVNQLNQLKNNQETQKNTNSLLEHLSDVNRVNTENTIKTLEEQTDTLNNSINKLNDNNSAKFDELKTALGENTQGETDFMNKVSDYIDSSSQDTLSDKALNSDSLNNVSTDLDTFFTNIKSSVTDMTTQYDNVKTLLEEGKIVDIPTYSSVGCFDFTMGGKVISLNPCNLPDNIKSVIYTLLSSAIYILFIILSVSVFLRYALPVIRGGN